MSYRFWFSKVNKKFRFKAVKIPKGNDRTRVTFHTRVICCLNHFMIFKYFLLLIVKSKQ